MNKKILIAILILIVIFFIFYFLKKPSNTLTNPISTTQNKIFIPSETLIDYADPSGFSFSYPDNLSLDIGPIDDITYSNLTLSSKEVSGSLTLKITDSKFKTLEDFVKSNEKAILGTPKDILLGKLKAVEIATADRLLIGSLDQGIFFSIEIPLVEKEFWAAVKDKILNNFSFTSPASASGGNNTTTSTDDVSFEGEEVVQ